MSVKTLQNPRENQKNYNKERLIKISIQHPLECCFAESGLKVFDLSVVFRPALEGHQNKKRHGVFHNYTNKNTPKSSLRVYSDHENDEQIETEKSTGFRNRKNSVSYTWIVCFSRRFLKQRRNPKVQHFSVRPPKES